MASRRAYFGAEYFPTAPAGTPTPSPPCASTVTPPDSTNSWPSITKLYSLCGCSSVHDSSVSSHSNSAGSDQPPCTGGMMARHLGLSCPLKSVREIFVGVLAASAIALFLYAASTERSTTSPRMCLLHVWRHRRRPPKCYRCPWKVSSLRLRRRRN